MKYSQSFNFVLYKTELNMIGPTNTTHLINMSTTSLAIVYQCLFSFAAEHGFDGLGGGSRDMFSQQGPMEHDPHLPLMSPMVPNTPPSDAWMPPFGGPLGPGGFMGRQSPNLGPMPPHMMPPPPPEFHPMEGGGAPMMAPPSRDMNDNQPNYDYGTPLNMQKAHQVEVC
jgi:hypothetical protein